MTREEEIIQIAHQKEKEVGFSQFVHNAKGVNSAYGIGFLEGADWADKHPDINFVFLTACEAAQYIDKSALVAEIERRIKEIDEIGTYLSPKGVLTNLLCHLDTLEVKEVTIYPN